MNCCYILHSEHLQRFYIGACHEDLQQRIVNHNEHTYGTSRFTAKAHDWQLFMFIECNDYAQAIRIERHIKRMKSSTYIQNLIKFPEMIEKLKQL